MPGVLDEPHSAAGTGWQASITDGQITLVLDPGSDDALEQAIDELLAPTQRRFWNVRFLYEDDGQDVWLLERAGHGVLADVYGGGSYGHTRFPARVITQLGNDLVTVPA